MRDLPSSTIDKVFEGRLELDAKEAIMEVLTDLDRGNEYTACTWHPYGFLSLKLRGSFAGRQVLLHFWPVSSRTRQVPDWPIHRHSWDLRSTLLCGTLTNTIFRLTLGKSDSSCPIYEVRYANGASIIDKTSEEGQPFLVSQTTYCAGDSYQMTADQFHTVDAPAGQLTATLAVSLPLVVHAPWVVGARGYESTYTYKRRSCDPEVFHDSLRSILGSLGD